MDSDTLSVASTQNDDDVQLLDDLLKGSLETPKEQPKSLEEKITEASLHNDLPTKSSDRRRNGNRPTRGRRGGISNGFNGFRGTLTPPVLPPLSVPSLMGIGVAPHSYFSTPLRPGAHVFGGNRGRMTPSSRNSGTVRRPRVPTSDSNSSPESLHNDGTLGISGFDFSAGSHSPDSSSRMKPFLRTSPFVDERNLSPRCTQRNNKGEVTFPLVYLSPAGSIAVVLQQDLIVETTVDRSVRVVSYGNFSVYVNHRGTASSIVHPNARVLHQESSVSGKFSAVNDKMVIFGQAGVLFSMDHLREAYLVSAAHKGAAAVAIDRLEFPKMNDDCTLLQFYRESQTGSQFLPLCKDIVDEATYDRRADGSLVMQINGMNIRYSANGDLNIDARPRHITCTNEGSIHVRTSFIDTSVQSSEMAFIKFGMKRVHISRSGMVVSDGCVCTSMDHFGRIIACT